MFFGQNVFANHVKAFYTEEHMGILVKYILNMQNMCNSFEIAISKCRTENTCH
jgi:hypothetical protein